MKKVGIILPPEFRRLPAMQGGMCRWFEAYQKGLLPKPHAIIGVSAGAIIGSACLPWTEENFAKVSHLIKNLERKQIFTIPRDVETELLLLAAPYLLFFADFKDQSRIKKFLLNTGEVTFSLVLAALLFRQFLKRTSLFSTKPLYQLLKTSPDSRLDFNATFNSDIRFEMIATEMKSGKEVVFCNHTPKDQDPERFVRAILASASLPGQFPPITLDGKTLGDGGILGYVPLHRAVAAGCDVIVVFLFTPLNERRALPKDFMEELETAAHITGMLATRLAVEAYREKVKNGVRLPALHIIETTEPLAELTFKSFTSEALANSMNFGWGAVDKDLPLLQKLVA